MRCSHCGAEMTIKKLQTGTDRHGNPIYHRYALCYHCKVKRNLDNPKRTKARAKKRKRIILATIISLLTIALCAGVFFFYRQAKEKEEAQKEEAVVVDTRKNLITVDDYAQITTGMTLSNVEDITRTSGNRLLQATKDDKTLERYQWITESGKGTVTLSFTDDMLTSISQTGMEVGFSNALSEDTISKLKPGISYKKVTALLGNGNRLSETISSGVTSTIYTWETEDHSKLISILFENGKIVHINQDKNKLS